MRPRTRLRLLAATPFLLAAGLCDWIGCKVYGRDFREMVE